MMTTATLNGGRHVVERAEETQPTPNINAQEKVMYRELRKMLEMDSVPVKRPEIIPIKTKKMKEAMRVIPSTIIVLKKALSLVSPMNMYRRMYWMTMAPRTIWVMASATDTDSKAPA